MSPEAPAGVGAGDDSRGFSEFPASGTWHSILEPFEEHVRRAPSRVALAAATGDVRYGDLDRTANRIGQQLLAACGPGEGRVGLIFRKAPALLPALLGVLKAGKVYVPVDPSYPAPRVEYILEDSDASVVLTDSDTLALTRELVPATRSVINIDEIPLTASAERPCVDISSDCIATLLYTSGSTGTPKGVMQNHRNLLQHIRNYTNHLGIRSDERVSLLFSCSFSASLLDIFAAFANGATLCPFDVRAEGTTALVRWVDAMRITNLHMVPSLFRRFTSELTGNEALDSVRRIDLAGEVLHPADVAAQRRFFGEKCTLYYRFAASEASFITVNEIGPDTVLDEGPVAVGRPGEGMEVLIRDETDSDLPPGEVGEIVLRSAFLCPGYWRKPDLTAKTFASEPGGGRLRLYHTGDLGRWRPDGNLDHLGRGDSRVKIRGYTVDLAEVESALRKLAGVREAVVVTREAGSKEADLAAFVVPVEGVTFPRAGLRVALLEVLPEYMVPSVIVPTPSLPLMPTGKLDHGALSEMASQAVVREGPPVEPRDSVESALTRIWREELRPETLGVQDDFFELGGDSLAAIQIVSRIESELGQALPTSILHMAPTIEQLAARLRTMDAVRNETIALPFRVHGSEPPLFAIPGRGGDPIVFSYLARSLSADRPFYGLATPGLARQQPIPRSFEELAAVHREELRRVQPRGPYYLLGFSSGAMVAYELARQLEASGESVALLVSLDGWAPGFPEAAYGGGWLRRLGNVGPARSVILARKAGILSLLVQMGKDIGREIACRFDEVLGKPLSRTQRYRRTKRHHTRQRIRYRPGAVEARLTLFRAADPGIPGGYRREALYGWDRFAAGGVDVYDFPGEHDDLVYEPTVDLVAKQLDECMAKGTSAVQASGPPRPTAP